MGNATAVHFSRKMNPPFVWAIIHGTKVEDA